LTTFFSNLTALGDLLVQQTFPTATNRIHCSSNTLLLSHTYL